MKVFAIALALCGSLMGQSRWLYSETVVLDKHQEGTWYMLADGRSVKVAYDPGTWPMVDQWPTGKPLLLAYARKDGPTLVDPDSGKFVSVYLAGPNHPIDSMVTKCLDEKMTTQGMVECVDAGAINWAAEIQRNYDLLMKSLDGVQRSALEAAQKQWTLFFQAQRNAIVAIDTEGSISRISRVQSVSQLNREHALRLALFLTLPPPARAPTSPP